MAAISLVTANRVRVIRCHTPNETGVAGEAITAGKPVRYDPTTGKVYNSAADTAPHAKTIGYATETVAAGMPVTWCRDGLMDGFDLSGLSFNDPVYLQDAGGIGTTAGTVSTILGYVHAANSQLLGSNADKILLVKCPN